VFAAIFIASATLGSIILAAAGLQWESVGTFFFRLGATGFLLTLITLFFFLLLFRYLPAVQMKSVEHREFLWISPIGPGEAIIVDSPTDDLTTVLREYLAPRRASLVRLVVARDINLSAEFFRLLLNFPNLLVLDIQRSILDNEARDALSELCDLEILLLNGVVDKREALGLELLLPEVNIYYEPRRIGILDRAIHADPPPIRPTLDNSQPAIEAEVVGSAELASPVTAEIK
jgi:hypothetical protein